MFYLFPIPTFFPFYLLEFQFILFCFEVNLSRCFWLTSKWSLHTCSCFRCTQRYIDWHIGVIGKLLGCVFWGKWRVSPMFWLTSLSSRVAALTCLHCFEEFSRVFVVCAKVVPPFSNRCRKCSPQINTSLSSKTFLSANGQLLWCSVSNNRFSFYCFCDRGNHRALKNMLTGKEVYQRAAYLCRSSFPGSTL